MRVWTLLGSHRLAWMLMAVLALLALLGGTLPQAARLSPEERQGWQQSWGGAADWLDNLRLSDVFGTPWFWTLCLLLLLNVTVGTVLSVQRRLVLLRGMAPPRFEGCGSWPIPPSPAISRLGYLGLWGAPLGHLGIAVVVVAGMGSALAGFGAHLELVEGEVYEGASQKLVVDRGRFAGFGGALRLDSVDAQVAEGAHLRELALTVSWQEAGGEIRRAEISSNRPLEVAGYRVYPDNTFGQSVVLERRMADGERRLLLVNFRVPRAQWGTDAWRAEQNRALALGGEHRQLRMVLEGEPARLTLQVSRADEVLFAGMLAPGDSAAVGEEQWLLRQVTPWGGLYLAADAAAPWAFTGMVLLIAGFAMHLVWPYRRFELIREGEQWRMRLWVSPTDSAGEAWWHANVAGKEHGGA